MTLKSFKISVLLLLMMMASCKKQLSEMVADDVILTEKDLIPEGTALDKRTGIVYIGSTHKRKIIQIDPDGIVDDFIPQEYEGIWSPVGMEVDEKNDLLWLNVCHANEVMPLVNAEKDRDWMTGIAAFSISKKKWVKNYSLDGPNACLNDITVLPDGSVYVTESMHNSIYRITPENDTLEVFLKPEGFSFLNGITYDASRHTLFVSSTQGVLKIDVASKNYTLLDTKANINAKGIDGLTYYKGSLIGHQSIKVSRFYLSADNTVITAAELLGSGPEFDSSTTGEVGNDGYYHFIVNSQIRSGVNYEQRRIKPLDSLENIIIRNIKL